METEANERLTLRLEGSEVREGLPLASLEVFVDSLLSALRDFDRIRRAERPRQPGRPGRREEMVTALRLVEFRIGSAVLTIEPIRELHQEDELFRDGHTVAYSNATALLDAIEGGEPLETSVADSLARAARSLGEGGRFEVQTEEGGRRVHITEERVRNLELVRETTDEGIVVSGRLHMIDLEPDRVAIRAPDGVEWSCRYPESLENEVVGLIGAVVWARGTGRRLSPRTGSLDLAEIHSVPQNVQTGLFVLEDVSIPELVEQQRVTGPQGVRSLEESGAEEPSELYYRAILGSG